MRTPLAWKNLLHDRTRTLVASAGVAFAVVLILVQLGFYTTVIHTATLIHDRLVFDIQLRSPAYLHLSKSDSFPRSRLYQALGLSEVEAADPFYVGFNLWKNEGSTRRRGIMVMAFDPLRPVLDLPEVIESASALTQQEALLFDRRSRSEFQPREPGSEPEIGRRKMQIVGQFTLGTGFGADGAILVSDRTFASMFPQRSPENVSLGLVRLKPGTDPDEAARRLRERLPPDVLVLTRAEVNRHEQRHWLIKTSVGIIFGSGVLVALAVGMAIVYQVLASDVADHLGEYATLKAMGYSRGYLAGVVLRQAAILSLLGFGPGLAISVGIYRLTRAYQHLPTYMDAWRAFGVMLLSLVMCSTAALMALRKVHAADPADLF